MTTSYADFTDPEILLSEEQKRVLNIWFLVDRSGSLRMLTSAGIANMLLKIEEQETRIKNLEKFKKDFATYG